MQALQGGWDDPIGPDDSDFSQSGLHRASAIRPSYVYAAEIRQVQGVIGRVDAAWLDRVRRRLAQLLD
jgi:hypothetical protein